MVTVHLSSSLVEESNQFQDQIDVADNVSFIYSLGNLKKLVLGIDM